MRNVIDKQIGSARDDSKVRSSTIRAEQPIAHSASIDLTVKLIVPINEYTYVRTKVRNALCKSPSLSLSLSRSLSLSINRKSRKLHASFARRLSGRDVFAEIVPSVRMRVTRTRLHTLVTFPRDDDRRRSCFFDRAMLQKIRISFARIIDRAGASDANASVSREANSVFLSFFSIHRSLNVKLIV